ncbi:MAG: VWA domain-containing protein [Phycisphaerae bacterium]
MTRYSPIAAVFILLAVLVPLLTPSGTPTARGQDMVSSNGGRLEAFGGEGRPLGPCPLRHTDVDVRISGRFTRVTLTQKFENPFHDKIEAVYTFPMSHRAAVDRMTMTIGDRVIVGEVKERAQARRIYEAARQAGHVTGLLEQERPNIFTQSVANIEPGAVVDVTISYVETLESKDGTFKFDFPMVVAPRYIPGTPTDSRNPLPAPEPGQELTTGEAPVPHAPQGTPVPAGRGFSPDTTQVPDASRITPMPVRPERRAGHDIGIAVTIDTGGPGIVDLRSELHDVVETRSIRRDDGAPRVVSLMLKREKDIPNRDFVLTWKQTADTIQEAVFTHTGRNGNFVTLLLQPPEQVKDAEAVARELVFVMDTSGSMHGLPMAKSREVVSRCLAALRPQDSFNIVTFSGDTHILWEKPRPGTPENIAAARKFVESREGRGGTEMMKAIEAALVQPPEGTAAPLSAAELMNLPADGREVSFVYDRGDTTHDPLVRERDVPAVESVRLSAWLASKPFRCPMLRIGLKGRWVTENAERVFVIASVEDCTGDRPAPPVRICCFFTDGEVGNDQAIIAAVQRNSRTTRVFSFGIGNSVNRYLLDGMARAGRGEVEYVLLNGDADAAVERFSKRVQTPVLTDVELTFGEGLEVTDVVGDGVADTASYGPDGSPVKADEKDAKPAIRSVRLMDLFDVKPIVLHARYGKPGHGTLTITGRTATGTYTRALPLDLPARQPDHDTIATLWARAKVEQIMNQDLVAAQRGQFPRELRDQVVKLGETFGIMTQYTSFVAVEKQRITLGGQPRLVAVPIEFPQGMSYEGVFGCQVLENMVASTPPNLPALLAAYKRIEDVQNEPDAAKRSQQLVKLADEWRKAGKMDEAGLALAEARGLTRSSSRERLAEHERRTDASMVPVTLERDEAENKVFAGEDGNVKQLRELREQAAAGLDRLGYAAATGRPATDSFDYFYASPDQGPRQNSRGPSAPLHFADVSALHDRGEPAGATNVLMWGQAAAPAHMPSIGLPILTMEQQSQVRGGAANGREVIAYRSLAMIKELADAPAAGSTTVLSVAPTRPAETGGWGGYGGLAPTAPGGGRGTVAGQPATQPSVATRPADTAARLADWLGLLKSADQLEWARKALVPQRVAIQIAELATAGQLEEALRLAEALVKFDAEFKLAAQMRDALADAKLTKEQRAARVAELAAEAKKSFDPIIREMKLRDRLDRRLYAYAKLGKAAATRPAGETVKLTEVRHGDQTLSDQLRVTVKAAGVEPADLEALTRVGLVIEGTARPARLIVGAIAPEKLADLAVLDTVRRVIPTETTE